MRGWCVVQYDAYRYWDHTNGQGPDSDLSRSPALQRSLCRVCSAQRPDQLHGQRFVDRQRADHRCHAAAGQGLLACQHSTRPGLPADHDHHQYDRSAAQARLVVYRQPACRPGRRGQCQHHLPRHDRAGCSRRQHRDRVQRRPGPGRCLLRGEPRRASDRDRQLHQRSFQPQSYWPEPAGHTGCAGGCASGRHAGHLHHASHDHDGGRAGVRQFQLHQCRPQCGHGGFVRDLRPASRGDHVLHAQRAHGLAIGIGRQHRLHSAVHAHHKRAPSRPW